MLVQKDAPIKFRIHKANTGEGDYDMSDATFSVTPVDAEAEPLITEATDVAGDVDLSNPPLRSIPITQSPRRRRLMGSSSTRKPLPSTSTPMARWR